MTLGLNWDRQCLSLHNVFFDYRFPNSYVVFHSVFLLFCCKVWVEAGWSRESLIYVVLCCLIFALPHSPRSGALQGMEPTRLELLASDTFRFLLVFVVCVCYVVLCPVLCCVMCCAMLCAMLCYALCYAVLCPTLCCAMPYDVLCSVL